MFDSIRKGNDKKEYKWPPGSGNVMKNGRYDDDKQLDKINEKKKDKRMINDLLS
jgi:hypothetical protein